jgi:WD40 repeat protein
MASGSIDSIVRLWDAATGALQGSLEGHSDWVHAVAFSLDGKLVASGSSDCTVKLWNTAIGVLRETLKVPGMIERLSFSNHGSYLDTNIGLLRIQSTHPDTPSLPAQPVYSISVNQDWVARDAENLLWLPPDFRAECVAARCNLLVLGHASGRITFIELS